jgi:hypothetical protein
MDGICGTCGKSITMLKIRPKKFCSVKCRNINDAEKYLGSGNPNFGNRKPNMFKHTDEVKKQIKHSSPQSLPRLIYYKPEDIVKFFRVI